MMHVTILFYLKLSLLTMATSRMAFLDLNFKLPLQIHTIEGALEYKIASDTPWLLVISLKKLGGNPP